MSADQTAHISMDSILDDVFATLYPGWQPNRLMVEGSELPPIQHRNDEIRRVSPGVRGSHRPSEQQETVSAIRALARRNMTRQQVAERLGLTYQWVAMLAREHNIQFRRAPWGGHGRGREE